MKKTDIKTFGILGGDKRQLFLADSLVSDGYEVLAGGFERLSGGAMRFVDIKTAIKDSDAVIFPVPCIRADRSLNTPFSDKNRILDSDDVQALCEKPCFAGMSSRLVRAYPKLSSAEIFDYSARDDFAVLNALPTAEGALELAMREYEGTISGSKTLVTGFGRIGKLLARLLQRMDSSVTVSARKPSDIAYASALGYDVLNTEHIEEVSGFDIVFNTVPDMIFDIKLLEKTDINTLIIDLASLPGGVDLEAAQSLGIDAMRALALPGKCAPKTAGEIIKTTVYRIIEEVYR